MQEKLQQAYEAALERLHNAVVDDEKEAVAIYNHVVETLHRLIHAIP